MRDSAKFIATMSSDIQKAQLPRLNEFLSQHAVFTVEELDLFLRERGAGSSNTRKSLLTYYRNQGRILPLRRGLYAVVPFGAHPESVPVDPYLVASKMTPDAVLAYHTALEFHGKAYSVYTRLHYLTTTKSLPLKFRSYEFRGVPVPPPLQKNNKASFGVICQNRSGVELRVTNLERTLVDVLHRPDLSGSWEEIWRSLESVEFFDLDQVVEYTQLLKNGTTAAKVGFYLEQHRESLMVGDVHLNQLHSMRPRQPHYLMRGHKKDSRWLKEWNLIVPVEIIHRSWAEVL